MARAKLQAVVADDIDWNVGVADAPTRFNEVGIVVDGPLARARPDLLAAAWTLFEQKRPLKVLHYGAGEGADPGLARELHQFCASLAQKTGGTYDAIVSGSADLRLDGVDRTARLHRGAARPLPLEARTYDVVVSSPVEGANEHHPLHSFWSFLELEPLLVDGGLLAFGDCKSSHGDRAEHVETYLRAIGQSPMSRGAEAIWLYRANQVPPFQTEPLKGVMEPLTGNVEFKREGFFRLFDQLFAPLLSQRAGSFRRMFEHLLMQPGPYTIIETGTTRPSGDFKSNGQSTMVFDIFVNFFGGKVISVDIDAGNVFFASTNVSKLTTIYCSDSVRALRALPEVKDAQVIYLDSYDFDGNNPHPSSFHHILELAAIQGRTRKDCLLVIDDCFGPNHGKHAYVARYLESRGNNPLYAGYHTAWMLS